MEEIVGQIVSTADGIALEELTTKTARGARIAAFKQLHDFPTEWQKKALVLALRSPQAFKREMASEAAIGRKAFVEQMVQELERHSIRVLPSDLEDENIRLRIAAGLGGEPAPKFEPGAGQQHLQTTPASPVDQGVTRTGANGQSSETKTTRVIQPSASWLPWLVLGVGIAGLAWLFLLKRKP